VGEAAVKVKVPQAPQEALSGEVSPVGDAPSGLTQKNAGRIVELDFARALIILTLPLIHLDIEFENMGLCTAVPLGYVSALDFFNAYAANLFMVLLGMNLVFSKNSTPKRIFSRGVRMVGFFFLLNLLRCTIPATIAGFMGYEEGFHEALIQTVASDIYFLSGAAFILIAAAKKISLPPYAVLGLALFGLALDNLVPQGLIGSEFWGAVAGNFLTVDDNSIFPVLSWMVFPALGYCIGGVFKSLQGDPSRKGRFYAGFTLITLMLTVNFIIGRSLSGMGFTAQVRSMVDVPTNNFFNSAMGVLFGMVTICAGYYLCTYVFGERVKAWLTKISDSVFTYYFLQWVIVGWVSYMMAGAGVAEKGGVSPAVFLLLSFAVWVLTLLLALPINAWLKRRKRERQAAR